MYYRPRVDPDQALRAVWSSSVLSGPFDEDGRRRAPPFYVPDVDEGSLKQGLVALHGAATVGCFSYCVADDESIDLVFGIPLVQLGRVWPDALDEQHIGGEWELPVEELLLVIATDVYALAPFQRALTGVEVGACPDELEPPEPLPVRHWLGIIEPRNGELTWYPPTERAWAE
jgi:hypothetical protein